MTIHPEKFLHDYTETIDGKSFVDAKILDVFAGHIIREKSRKLKSAIEIVIEGTELKTRRLCNKQTKNLLCCRWNIANNNYSWFTKWVSMDTITKKIRVLLFPKYAAANSRLTTFCQSTFNANNPSGAVFST